MKVARTFTIDLTLVKELQNKKNQSSEVCKALRAWLHPEMFNSIHSIPTRQLMAALHDRDDISEELKVLLWHHLQSSA